MLNGKKLQFLRLYHGYSQKYIADAIGVSERWIGKIENEGFKPSDEVYEKYLSAIYGKLKPNKKKAAKETETE
jgi:transcriptional regulator with XRE-family HTH domain